MKKVCCAQSPTGARPRSKIEPLLARGAGIGSIPETEGLCGDDGGFKKPSIVQSFKPDDGTSGMIHGISGHARPGIKNE
jgi:hypothetical protein